MNLIAVDPGALKSALAYFRDGTLRHVKFIPTIDLLEGCAWPDEMIIEKPQIYRRSKSKGDPNDLIDIALIAGAWWRASGGRAELVLPKKWKGDMEKPQCHARAWRVLTDAERELFVSKSFQTSSMVWDYIEHGVRGGAYKAEIHNLLDACAIGLWKLGRVK